MLSDDGKKRIDANLPRTDDGFVVVGQFGADGVADGAIDPDWGPVSHVRLNIHASSENWVILSELHLKRPPRD